MALAVTQKLKHIFCTALLLCIVIVKAQSYKAHSSVELDSLLQSKSWFCASPVGYTLFYDSLNVDRVLLPKFVERFTDYVIKFDSQNITMEDGLFFTCGTESHSLISGLYYLNGDGTVTVQFKWSECRGQLCFGETRRQDLQVPSSTYRILVQDESLILKLIK